MPNPITDRDTSFKDAGAEFVRSEVSGGIVLLVAAAAALIWANLPFGESYFSFWHTELTVGFGDASVSEDLQHWVNDGLMTIFFFLVGLEIKREMVNGELNDRRKATLPVLAAAGGAALPALIFFVLNAGGEGADGWAIPMATDIAFAVAVLAILGDRVSGGTRLLLLTIAIVDDIIAIVIIAAFYSDSISFAWLAGAAAGLLAVALLRRLGVSRTGPYVMVGALVWLATLESGVHATIAGVALGLMTPAHPFRGRHVLEGLEHRLHPYSSMLIVPVFALANAGVAFGGDMLSSAFSSTIFWGIAVGLVLGKLVGIAGTSFLVQRLGIGALPDGVERRHVVGIAALGGIGFTVSLFLAQLSYTDELTVETAKVGIFAGSLVSAALGCLLLIRSSQDQEGSRAGRSRPGRS